MSIVCIQKMIDGTYRGAGGYWRTYQATQLATPEAFADNPSLVWEFYHYRREVMGTKNPNPAHKVTVVCPDESAWSMYSLCNACKI